MRLRTIAISLTIGILSVPTVVARTIRIASNETNDLYNLLLHEGVDMVRYSSADEALSAAAKGDALIITATDYPAKSVSITPELLDNAHAKKLRVYAEYVSEYPGVKIAPEPIVGKLERGVISSRYFEPQLKSMDIIGLNGCHIFDADVKKPLISFAKVAGYDVAQYGLDDTDVYPLLWSDGDCMTAFSCLTNFKQARYAPVESWKQVWTSILRWLTRNNKLELTTWSAEVVPAYGANDELPADAALQSIKKGTEWLYKGRFIVHPSWLDSVLACQGDGLYPFGKPVSQNNLSGNGSLGVLEGHASSINHLGEETYRYWMRADVQGETAFLLASAAQALDNPRYASDAENVLDYLFYTSNFREGEKKKAGSPAYGLIGWSATHPHVFYNDDNARAILGAIGASALTNNNRWDSYIEDCIMANFNLCSRQGFLPDRIEEPDLLKNGVEYYSDRDFVLPHPHFDSWMWACYLWLYDKTGDQRLLDKAESAIRITMEAYPDNWHWTNGIQQERARMILPLAWLVRVDDTPEHRKWLDTVVDRLLQNQVVSGAIREELGDDSFGMYGKTKSNRDYGVTEAPLIGQNGDPVADMLYTCNFAFFALNEAAHATGEKRYHDAVGRLSDFLIRIQATSKNHPDMDGAWLRAFDYDRWDYWASNADSGWGAWCTLTGWIQSWIIGTQALVERDNSFWTMTSDARKNNKKS